MLDADVVREQRGDASLEAVELRPGVLADREHEVHAQVGLVDEPRELDREGALAVLVRVVEEVVLELVEHDEERAHPLGPGADGLDERLAGPPGRQLLAAERLARTPPRIASASAGSGSSRQLLNAQIANGVRSVRPAAFARTCSCRSWTTPACSSDVLPTPLAP